MSPSDIYLSDETVVGIILGRCEILFSKAVFKRWAFLRCSA
ncbi:hypothetical protein AtNW77_Chr1g0037551 [Arabidopsis thaliana]